MKKIVKLLFLFLTITSCSIKAQDQKLLNGNVNIGTVNYSVISKEKSSIILISSKDILDQTWDISKKNPKKDIIPKSELKLNIPELTKLKNEILGDNTAITVRFYYYSDEKLMGLEYDLRKEYNVTIKQFKKFDQEIRKTVKGSLARSFDYSTYLPYVVRSVILK
ncbi:MAG: hypothetical protein LBF27_05685 [Sphingobacterium sp.]|jgi:hypothetical protein|nr:hypothetical protein [Sphingobacterium sp.]